MRDRGTVRSRVAIVCCALVALLFLPGCTRARQISEWLRARGADPAGGATIDGIPSDVLASGPYLASTLALHFSRSADGLVVGALNTSRFSVGRNQFLVVNKWGKLKPNQYVERVQILAPDRKTELGVDSTPFRVDDFWNTVTIVSGFRTEFERPGTYWVRVFLNDQKVTEYPFRVTPRGAVVGS